MPPGITIVGLGPGAPGQLTVEAQQVLSSAPAVYLRTRQHPTVAALDPRVELHSFDSVYEQCSTFEEVYATIAREVIELGRRPEGVVYAVPGHPRMGEASVRCILDLAHQNSLPVRIVEGLSFLEPICTQLGADPLDGLQIADATTLAQAHFPAVDPDQPLLVGQVYSREIAAELKLSLMMVYPDDHPVTLLRAAGTEQGALRRIPLYDLDRGSQIDHLTSLWVPPLAQPGGLVSFEELVAHLRAPEGCPWDREQTHTSLRPYLLQEAYEVLEALDREDPDALKEELGDLLLQIVLHAQIATEEQEFKMADVVSNIVTKLKRRHPHVFGQVTVSGARDVLVNWERIKSEEKRQARTAAGKPAPRPGMLSGVPPSLPALARAQELLQRAARSGLEEPGGSATARASVAWEKLQATSGAAAEEPLGDLLLALTDLSRYLQVDAESALRAAIQRLESAIARLEERLEQQGQELHDLNPAERLQLWSEAQKEAADPPHQG